MKRLGFWLGAIMFLACIIMDRHQSWVLATIYLVLGLIGLAICVALWDDK
jgi:hypothetical protein